MTARRPKKKDGDIFAFLAPRYDRFMKVFGLYRARELRETLSQVKPGGALLDVAGGTGFLAEALADRFERVVVADISPGMLSQARQRNLETVCAPAEALPFADGSFDVVLCADALHHIKQQERALNEVARVVKPGGTVVIQEFHIRGLRGWLFFLFERLFIDHSVFIGPERLSLMMEQRQFTGAIRKLSGLGYLYAGSKL